MGLGGQTFHGDIMSDATEVNPLSAGPTETEGLIRLVIGVTGHRDLRPEERDATEQAVRGEIEALARRYPGTPLRLISSLAEGADRLVARVFLEMRDTRAAAGMALASSWDLVVPLPFAEASYAEDFPETLSEYQALRNAAGLVFTVPQRPSHAEAERRVHGRARDLQYLDASLFVIRHSHVLFGLWDGEPTDRIGATAQIVGLKLGRATERHFNASIDYHDHDVGPVAHFRIGRLNSGPAPSGQGPLRIARINPDDAELGFDAFHNAFADIDVLNALIHTWHAPELATRLDTAWAYLTGPARDRAPALLETGDVQSVHAFSAVDQCAITLERQRKRLVRSLYVLGGFATFFLWTAVDGLARGWMIGAYAACFAAILLLLTRLQSKNHVLDQFLYRMLAESLRVQIYCSLSHAGRANAADSAHSAYPFRAIDSFLGQQLHELGWVREALRGMIVQPRTAPPHEEALRREVSNFWISDQEKWFEKRRRSLDGDAQRSGWLARAVYVAGVVFAGVFVVENARLGWPHLLDHGLGIAAAIAPAMALLLQGYQEKMSFEDQAKSYERMGLIFRRAERHLATVEGHAGRRAAILRGLAAEAVTETTNWLILKKSRTANLPI